MIGEKTPEQILIDAGWNDFRTNGKSFKEISINAIQAAYDLGKSENEKQIKAIKNIYEIAKLDGSSKEYITGVAMCCYLLGLIEIEPDTTP